MRDDRVRLREPSLVIPALRQVAEGKPCMVKLECCRGDPRYTVWAHSNFLRHGRGIGEKSSDPFGFLACDTCHYEIDYGKSLTRADREWIVQQARDRTLDYLFRHRHLRVVLDP